MTASPPSSDPLSHIRSALADRYRVERELGAGGMATVYLAHDLRHDRDVAIKVLHPDLGVALGVERFLAEIRTTARLQHPHIVPVFDSGHVGDTLYFVMPLVEGETLRARIARERRLPVSEAVRIVREVADALDFAHTQGILHRDLKPENILLSRGHAVLADFGIAASMRAPEDQRLTRVGTSLGTPAYMSPEQATADRDLGPESDVYALSTILFELLTGELPFTGATFEAMIVQRYTHDAPRCVSRRVDTPPACDAAIARALSREPADRFASARAFAAALGEPQAASPNAPGEQASLAVLPFTNLSPDAENGYFADGLTEEVIIALSKVRALRVCSRSTVMPYRDRTGTPGDIARELGVSHLLQGSVRKAGNRLRVTASLLDASRDAALWAERFDGSLDDVFDMQDRVAEAIVSALSLTLSAEERARLAEHPIADAAAYDAYLRAREGMNAWTATGLQRALEYLDEAARLAPDNLFVLRGAGRACWAAVNNSLSSDLTLLDDALRHAETINRISAGSPFAAEIRGLVAALRGDVATAVRELGLAYEAMPEDVDIGFWYGAFLIFGDRVEAGLAVARDVKRLDPGHPLVSMMESAGEWMSGRVASALARLEQGPGSAPPSIWFLLQGLVGLAAGDHTHALRALDRAAAEPADAMTALASFLAAATRGNRVAAAAILTPELEATLWQDFSYTEYAAEGFALLDDVAGIQKWLSRAAHLGASYYRGLSQHHALWRVWLVHPDVAPIFAHIRRNSEHVATIPLAPRVRALVPHVALVGATT
ncbi:protein kinase domain-containing protein [Gemmatimonas sp.]|uniref:protein kinase domain-containing protein n=1 Tax=Gemmatimonas sp. TaxID=1962908 RepID=UPI003983093F